MGLQSVRRVLLVIVVAAAACYSGDNVTASNPLSMNPMPTGRAATVAAGNSAPSDSVRVTMSGDHSPTVLWSATRTSSWATLANTTGISGAQLRWGRNSAGLSPGLYIDTITVTVPGAFGSPETVLDSLRITSGAGGS